MTIATAIRPQRLPSVRETSSRRAWAPADMRESPIATWRPSAPWSSGRRNDEADRSDAPDRKGLFFACFIAFVQAGMLWMLINPL